MNTIQRTISPIIAQSLQFPRTSHRREAFLQHSFNNISPYKWEIREKYFMNNVWGLDEDKPARGQLNESVNTDLRNPKNLTTHFTSNKTEI